MEQSENITGQILKASAIMGSSTAIVIGAGIINSKIMAVLLGPQGIGLLSIVASLFNTISTLFGMGISSSGVRQIAEARASGDEAGLALTQKSIWLAANLLGLLGASTIIIFYKPLARISFISPKYFGLIPWLGLGVWASIASGSQTAFLNGLRRVSDLAKINIIGSIAGMLLGVTAIWRFGSSGVVVVVIGSPIVTLFASFLYARKLSLVKIKTSLADLIRPMNGLLRLGLVFMTTGFMWVGTQYVVRIIITRTLDIVATGQFQAAWNISMTYLGFVLTAMVIDYYPRLTALANDISAVNAAANEQAKVAILLTGPMILGMITLSPLVVLLLYTRAFNPAISILRWQLMGDLFKVAGWALSYIFLARPYGRIYFMNGLFWNISYLILTWTGIRIWGLEATGIAFLVSYILYFFLLWFLAARMNNLSLSKDNRILLLIMSICLLIIACSRIMPYIWQFSTAIILTLGMAAYSLVKLYNLLGRPKFSNLLERL